MNSKELKQYLKDYDEGTLPAQNNDYFNVGKNEKAKIRILVEPVNFAQYWDNAMNKPFILVGADEGCPYSGKVDKVTVRYMTWVLDYKAHENGEPAVKLYEMPATIAKAIKKLQMEDEYNFDTYPMPYDLNIARDDTKEIVEYSVLPARQNSDVPAVILENMPNLSAPADIIEAKKQKRIKELNG